MNNNLNNNKSGKNKHLKGLFIAVAAMMAFFRVNNSTYQLTEASYYENSMEDNNDGILDGDTEKSENYRDEYWKIWLNRKFDKEGFIDKSTEEKLMNILNKDSSKEPYQGFYLDYDTIQEEIHKLENEHNFESARELKELLNAIYNYNVNIIIHAVTYEEYPLDEYIIEQCENGEKKIESLEHIRSVEALIPYYQDKDAIEKEIKRLKGQKPSFFSNLFFGTQKKINKRISDLNRLLHTIETYIEFHPGEYSDVLIYLNNDDLQLLLDVRANDNLLSNDEKEPTPVENTSYYEDSMEDNNDGILDGDTEKSENYRDQYYQDKDAIEKEIKRLKGQKPSFFSNLFFGTQKNINERISKLNRLLHTIDIYKEFHPDEYPDVLTYLNKDDLQLLLDVRANDNTLSNDEKEPTPVQKGKNMGLKIETTPLPINGTQFGTELAKNVKFNSIER